MTLPLAHSPALSLAAAVLAYWLRCRPCSQMLPPPQSLHSLRPPHSLHSLRRRPCSQMPPPPHSAILGVAQDSVLGLGK